MPAEPALATPAPSPSLTLLSGADLAGLLTGFYFVFWGLLATLAAVTESLSSAVLRPFTILILCGGTTGIAVGAWRLQRITGFGPAWQSPTRWLVATGSLLAYLSVFYVLWRQAPTETYFLVHTLAFFAVLLATIAALCGPVAVATRAADRPGLATQATACTTIALVVLVPLFSMAAQRLLSAAREGADPFVILRFWIERTPLWLAALLLLPVLLVLFLVWATKDVVLDELNTRQAEP